MVGYFFLGLLLLVAVLALLQGVSRANPGKLARWLKGAAVAIVLLVIGLLAVTGRLGMLWGLAGLAIPFAIAWRHRRAGAGRPPQPGQSSSIETAWLAMRLDHDRGAIEGEVRQGQYAGRALAALALEALLALRDEIGPADADSLQLLDAYLDRRFGAAWRRGNGDAAASNGAGDGAGAAPASNTGAAMTRTEALLILGLAEGASREAIEAAYRRLMMKLHPDHGGSDYLAARLNAARDLLLG